MKLKFNLRRLAVLNILAAVLLSLFIGSPLQAQTRKKPQVQTASINITKMGYEPGSLTLKRGIPARITFLRTVENTCATEVVFADYGITKELPLNQAVVVNFTPKTAGEFSFTCGMRMHRGKLFVK
jgi:plastocyanin domain-containing protein